MKSILFSGCQADSAMKLADMISNKLGDRVLLIPEGNPQGNSEALWRASEEWARSRPDELAHAYVVGLLAYSGMNSTPSNSSLVYGLLSLAFTKPELVRQLRLNGFMELLTLLASLRPHHGQGWPLATTLRRYLQEEVRNERNADFLSPAGFVKIFDDACTLGLQAPDLLYATFLIARGDAELVDALGLERVHQGQQLVQAGTADHYILTEVAAVLQFAIANDHEGG